MDKAQLVKDKLDPAKLKDRFKTLLPNKKDSAPEALSNLAKNVSFTAEEMASLPAIVRSPSRSLANAKTIPDPVDQKEDDQILLEVEEDYYQSDFDASRHVLTCYRDVVPDATVISGQSKTLSRQLTVVSKKVFAGILEKQSKCQGQMEEIGKIQSQLSDSLQVCLTAREGLAQTRGEFTSSSLGILAAYRRRQQINKLLHDLNIIKTLQKTDYRLQELLNEEDYPGAIQLILEVQKVVKTYSHFVAVKQLSTKLQDTLEMTEEQLDVALSKVCVDYNHTVYSRLHKAYKLLGKTQISMDQLHMHLTSAIHNTAWNVVHGHAMLSQATAEVDLSKKPYADLCASVGPASILPCLVDLCRALWTVMNAYRQVIQWHEVNFELEDDNSKHYIEKKLDTGKMRVWQEVQTKAKVFVLANDLSSLSIDHFLEFLDVIHRLIKVGRDFCGSSSDTLQESLKQQCWSYFHSYHLARLEELKMHLENEGWALCPVKPTFKVTQLVEFRHLREPNISNFRNLNSPTKRSNSPRKKSLKPAQSPFDPDYEDEDNLEETFLISESNGNIGEEGFYSQDEGENDSDEDVDEELKRDFIDENTGEAPKPVIKKERASMRKSSSSIVLTNTSLMLLRLCGKYLHLMKALEPIASNVFTSMTQLLEFYLVAVHEFFASNLPSDLKHQVTSQGLSEILIRVQEDLIRRKVIHHNRSIPSSPSNNSLLSQEPPSQIIQYTGIVDMPMLSPAVTVNEQPESLYGLAEKYVAVESLIFMADQIRGLRNDILDFLPKDKGVIFQEYESQTLSVIHEVRRPVYLTSARKAINSEVILQLMSKVSWDLKDVKSQHSQYVEVLLRDFQMFSLRLADVRKVLHVSGEARKVLWDLCTLCASLLFVEGFSSAKRCSNEGRALMQLDYRQFVMKLEKLCELKPLPYQDYVAKYVKAYYIPETDLEAWVQQHNTEYTAKQLVALVNCVAYSNNKTKQKLNSIISDLSTRIRK